MLPIIFWWLTTDRDLLEEPGLAPTDAPVTLCVGVDTDVVQQTGSVQQALGCWRKDTHVTEFVLAKYMLSLVESISIPIPSICFAFMKTIWAGPRLNIKRVFQVHGYFHYKDKTVVRPSYLYYGNPNTGKMTSLYWDGPQNPKLNPNHGGDSCSGPRHSPVIILRHTNRIYFIHKIYDIIWCMKYIKKNIRYIQHIYFKYTKHISIMKYTHHIGPVWDSETVDRHILHDSRKRSHQHISLPAHSQSPGLAPALGTERNYLTCRPGVNTGTNKMTPYHLVKTLNETQCLDKDEGVPR